MATIKSYTSLEQSKKLAEILPLESADMHYNDWNYDFYDGYEHTGIYVAYLETPETICGELDIPCWSLAALLGVLPDYTLQTNTDGTVFVVCDSKKPMISDAYDNPVDACCELILKLNELNLL